MINYVIGDATNPTAEGTHRIIAHCVNNLGVWGAGFVIALSKKWRGPQQRYECTTRDYRVLGTVEFVRVEPSISVANVYGQNGIGRAVGGESPVRYDALLDGFARIRKFIDGQGVKCTVHMPRIGCGLAGGEWERVRPLIEYELTRHGHEVFVYDLPPKARF